MGLLGAGRREPVDTAFQLPGPHAIAGIDDRKFDSGFTGGGADWPGLPKYIAFCGCARDCFEAVLGKLS